MELAVEDYGFEKDLEDEDAIAESPTNAVTLNIPPSQSLRSSSHYG